MRRWLAGALALACFGFIGTQAIIDSIRNTHANVTMNVHTTPSIVSLMSPPRTVTHTLRSRMVGADAEDSCKSCR